jgi:hypothetical protein
VLDRLFADNTQAGNYVLDEDACASTSASFSTASVLPMAQRSRRRFARDRKSM